MEPEAEKKPFKKPSFNPGTQKVKITAEMIKEVDAEIFFTHDDRPLMEFAHQFADATFVHHEAMTSNPDEPAEWEEKIIRMTCLVTAKKLATALSPSQRTMNSGVTSMIERMNMSAPTPLVGLLDGLGFVDEKEFEGVMIGQPFWAMTYLGRALFDGPDMGIYGRNDWWFINTNWEDSYRQFIDFGVGALSAWAEGAGTMNYELMPGIATQISVPKPVSGFGNYETLISSVPKSPYVLRVLGALKVVERVLEDIDVVPTAMQKATLEGFGVRLVNWKRDSLDPRLRNYESKVQARLGGVLGKTMGWGPVRALKPTGAGWQLVRDASSGHVTSPVKVSGVDLASGWMLAGQVEYTAGHDRFGFVKPISMRAKQLEWLMHNIKN